jgi:hypothetical protein
MLTKHVCKIAFIFSIIFIYANCKMSFDPDPSKWEFKSEYSDAQIIVTDSLTDERISGAQFGDYENHWADEPGWISIREPGYHFKTVTDSVYAPGYKSKLLTITFTPGATAPYYISLIPK